MKDDEYKGYYCLLIAILCNLNAAEASTMYEYGPDHPLCRKKARQISAGWEENEWVRCIVLEMISLLDSDDAERRRIALEVEKEMEAAEQKMNAA